MVDYTVVVRVRAQLGARDASIGGEENAPFVGPVASFDFDCPELDAGEDGVLVFQAIGVAHRRNVIRINGTDLHGGITTSIEAVTLPSGSLRLIDVWGTNVLLVPPGVLRSAGNELRIEARDAGGGTGDDIDEFVVDNAVVWFKTRGRPGPIVADA